MGSSVLDLHCTECKGHYQTKKEWLAHLLQRNHQERARQGLIGSWDRKKRRRALVVFSKQSVAQDDRIIQYFSKDVGIFVTDFVWWAERPRVGFLQFDSRKTVEKVISSLQQDLQLQVDNQLFQVKEAASILDFEWDALLPVPTSCDNSQRLDDSDSDGDSSSNNVLEPDLRPSPNTPVNIDFNNGNVASAAEAAEATTRNRIELEEDHRYQPPSDNPLPRPSARFAEYLLQQLQSIQKSVEIPDDEYNSILRLLSLLQQLFSDFTPNPQEESVTRAILSRNWSLKLKYFDNNPPVFIFIQRKKKRKSGSSLLVNTPLKAIDFQIRESKNGNLLFPSRASINRFYPTHKLLTKHPTQKHHFLFYSLERWNEGKPLEIKLTGDMAGNMETEIWRLIKYLCTFDPRCEPILSIVYFWVRTNSIQLGENIPREYWEPKCCISNAPDPLQITWLVILFLCREQLLPLPELIISRSKQIQAHRTLLLKTTIGFREDPEFAQTLVANKKVSSKESETFPSEIFSLVAKFFLFWGEQLGEGEWVINSETGEISTMEYFRNLPSPKGKMASIKALLNPGPGKNENPRRLHMTNPFHIAWKINLASDVKPYHAMLKTGKRLGEFLEANMNITDVNTLDQDFLKLFKI